MRPLQKEYKKLLSYFNEKRHFGQLLSVNQNSPQIRLIVVECIKLFAENSDLLPNLEAL